MGKKGDLIRYRAILQGEIASAALYHTLAEVEAQPLLAAVYWRLARRGMLSFGLTGSATLASQCRSHARDAGRGVFLASGGPLRRVDFDRTVR